jgi:hypothetical protein
MPRPSIPLFLVLCASAASLACAHDSTTTPLVPAAPSASATPTLSRGNDDARQGDDGESDEDSRSPISFAVIGDTPYGPAKMAEFPSLVAKINGDPRVAMVLHVGDIKAGKASPCTDAYFASVRALFDTFQDPLVYTPGDNEWTDCHVASKNNGLYTPTERLQAVRTLFFPVAGRTLGLHAERVLSQAADRQNSAYVENTLWTKSRVVFAALNITGSNNDGVSWGSPLPADAASYPSQAEERATRARANAAWIERAFATARATKAPGVVLMFQADMWDQAEPDLSGYDALVQQIGTLAARFGKPVLLLEGDSHAFRVDNPYSPTSVLHAIHPSTPIANNVTRIVVEGSDGRTEYVRLTVDPRRKAPALFAWERVPLQ